jgi:hypothetical protein
MVTLAAVLLPRAQVPLRVMTTDWPAFTPVVVPVQTPVNPEAKVTGGDAGTVNPAANATVMVLPVDRAPDADVVKPTV